MSKRTTIFLSFINFMDHHIGYLLYSIIFLYLPTLTSLFQLLKLSYTQAHLSPVLVSKNPWLDTLVTTFLLSCKCGKKDKRKFFRLAFRVRIKYGDESMNICHSKAEFGKQFIYSTEVSEGLLCGKCWEYSVEFSP